MHFWKIGKSTTPNEFKENMDKLGAISPEAAADLMGRNYEKWCRAFYTPQCQCDAVDNNMSEVFNAYILNSRHKPIITMLEDIRESIMERLHKKRDFFRSKNLAICPRAQEQLEKAKITARGWNSVYGGRFTIGVREGATQVRYVVDLLNKTCSCNAWQLNGIPCNHSVAAIWHNKERPVAYVAECYKKNMYLRAYDYLMEPLNGPKEWPPSQQPPIIAPTLKKVRVGRPKKARRPGPGENLSKTKKSRIGTTCTCSICGMLGHNIRGCKLAQGKQARSKKRIDSSEENSQGKPSSYQSQVTNPPMHNRGFGMYTYPNGFQRRGNMSARSENSVQETHLHPQHPQRRQRATQARQVAYYSDFEGEQTLRGITAMQGADTFIQSQTSSVSNDIPSFVDSRGRKCISSSTLQSWARK